MNPEDEPVQTTIKSPISFGGHGLHSGAPATVTVNPASAHHGIWFKRTDIALGDRMIPARWDAVNRSPLCTKLENAAGLHVSILSPGGLRHADEAVRHKMLDALGDLALAGAPLLGHYVGERAGHSLTNTLLRALFATPDAVRLVKCDPTMAARLPGYGLVWDEIPQVA